MFIVIGVARGAVGQAHPRASKKLELNLVGTGADPAIDGPGGRLPLRAWLLRIYCTKMHEIWSVDSQDNY